MDWPANPFWDYALELYQRPGVEGACLELQSRHGLDVNFVLLCCWLGDRGIDAEPAWLARVAGTAQSWQADIVHPLRAVRGSLKAKLTEPATGSIAARWPALTAALRQRVLGLEIDGERLEQLLLAELAADLAPTAAPGMALACANLGRYRRFAAPDRAALAALLGAAFPEVPRDEVAAALDGLDCGAGGGQPLPHG